MCDLKNILKIGTAKLSDILDYAKQQCSTIVADDDSTSLNSLRPSRERHLKWSCAALHVVSKQLNCACDYKRAQHAYTRCILGSRTLFYWSHPRQCNSDCIYMNPVITVCPCPMACRLLADRRLYMDDVRVTTYTRVVEVENDVEFRLISDCTAIFETSVTSTWCPRDVTSDFELSTN